jgi:hypothetical protein
MIVDWRIEPAISMTTGFVLIASPTLFGAAKKRSKGLGLRPLFLFVYRGTSAGSTPVVM